MGPNPTKPININMLQSLQSQCSLGMSACRGLGAPLSSELQTSPIEGLLQAASLSAESCTGKHVVDKLRQATSYEPWSKLLVRGLYRPDAWDPW